jgi:hypothetical protein
MVELVKVTIHNPTQAPRVIHGGEGGTEPIRIEPNEVKQGVILLKSLVTTLQAQASRAGAGNEVAITIEGDHAVERPPSDAAPEPDDAAEARPTQRHTKRGHG